jgi:hypothetical protein
MKTYTHFQIDILSKEISLLYKRQDELKKQLQEVCIHENKVIFNNVEYSGMLQNIEYCNECGKTIFLG